MTEEKQGQQQQQTLNGIDVRWQPGRVLVTIGDGKLSMTAGLPPDSARQIGMAILDRAIAATQAAQPLVQPATAADLQNLNQKDA